LLTHETEGKTYTIKGLLFDPKYGPEGAHSKNVKFLMRDKTKPDAEPTEISVYDYFYKQYNIKLTHWALPLIKTEKDGTFPLEVCNVISHQAFKYKLDPDETSDMIKFAVTKPSDRRDTVQHGVQMLKWNEDPYLRHYGVKIDPNMTVTKARLLPNPIIQMGEWTQKIDPKTSGKWDLRGKKFYKPNPEPLESWGVCVMDGCVELPALKNFLATFIQTYVNLGGKVKNRTPSLHQAGRGESPPDVVAAIRQKILDDCEYS
jgi:eukaryotic translation initiation factor 2C